MKSLRVANEPPKADPQITQITQIRFRAGAAARAGKAESLVLSLPAAPAPIISNLCNLRNLWICFGM